jgi:hypothetical protein
VSQSDIRAKRAIEAYAAGLSAGQSERAARELLQVAGLFDTLTGADIARLLRDRGDAVVSSRKSAPDSVIAHLGHVSCILKAGGGDNYSIKVLNNLSNLLLALDDSETLPAILNKLRDTMKPAPIEMQVAAFAERLKRETGTAAFERTFAELKASALKREHVVQVASTVYGRINKSTSRVAALAFIRKPHDASVSTRLGIEATGGRSAA